METQQTAAQEIEYEAIARRAYELYCERGCENGHDIEDWLNAEAELATTPTPVIELGPKAGVAQVVA